MWHVLETNIHVVLCYKHLRGREHLRYFGVDGDDIKMGSSESSVNARVDSEWGSLTGCYGEHGN
jgi:hypothetical protein